MKPVEPTDPTPSARTEGVNQQQLHATEPLAINVMTFNLRVNTPIDEGNAWPHRSHLAGRLIREAAPDIVGTQEGQGAMLADLDRELPGYSRIGEGRSGEAACDPAEDECCAIYYNKDRLSLLNHGQFWLSESPETPGSISWDSSYPRIVTWAVFRMNDEAGTRFGIFNTHFDHLGQQAREQSASLLLERIQQFCETAQLPVVLTGDFNAFPDNPAIVQLSESLTSAYSILQEPVGRTFHEFLGGKPGEPIDYIFATPSVSIIATYIHDEQLEGAYPSDHYPIRAQIRLTPSYTM